MVEAGHVVERALDAVLDLVTRAVRASARAVEAVLAGVEPRLEELPQEPGDVDVAAQRRLDVVDRERRVALLHVLRVGAQHRGLPPGQPGGEHQRVEAVDLVVAVPDRADGVLEQARARRRGGRAGTAARTRRRSSAASQAVELVGALVEHLHAHRRQHRQDLRRARAASRCGTPSAGPRRGRRRAGRTATGRCPGRCRSPRGGRRRARRWSGRSPPCRPPGRSRRTSGPAASRSPRRTPPRWR